MIRLFSRQSGTAQRGFTLIEVLMVIAILAIVMSSLYGIFSSVSRAKERLDSDSESYHRARVIFDRLGREIHGAYYNSGGGDSHFKGGRNEEDRFYLDFSTTAVSPLSIEGTGFAILSYLLDEDPEADTEDELVLLRTEQPLLGSNRNDNQPQALRLAPGILNMTASFYANGTWQENWDSTSAGLPERVRIELHVRDSRGEDVPFMTTFRLP